MNALQSYSSDEESAEEFATHKMPKVADPGTNYDDVGMDISEDSGDNGEATDNETSKKDSFTCNNLPSKPPATSSVKTEPTAAPLHDNHRKVSSSSHLHNELDKKDSFDKGRGSNSSDKLKDDRHATSGSKRDKDKDKERSSASSRDAQRESRDHKDSRRVSDGRGGDHRKGGRSDDRRSSRRSRSRSRDRSRRSRSRSRSRDRDRRRRRSRSRSRSRDRDKDRDRRRPHEIRKEAQQKLAAFKACNPNFDHNELLKRGMEAQFAEVQKNTGVTLPSYYNPATMNPLKIAEQERKKKLLWGNKAKAEPHQAPESSNTYGSSAHGLGSGTGNAGLWVNTTFSNDSDGKMAEKFKRLMGVKAMGASSTGQVNAAGGAGGSVREGSDLLQKQESMFSSMEKQYEMARLATHTHKGFGLGFSSQTYLPKP